MYLYRFTFPGEDEEFDFFMGIKRTCYDSFYPFQVLSKKGFHQIDFEPVTILYGGNGCGKTTVLNIIADKLGLSREASYNKSNFFKDYGDYCTCKTKREIPPESKIITSDDVFDYMLDLRSLKSAKRQLELVKFLEDSARFYGCQFIISTHSPFILSMYNAKIYDMDERPVDVKRWTELENVRIFYDFFMQHSDEFRY